MVGREGRAMTDDSEQITIHRGLMGVNFDRSPTTRIVLSATPSSRRRLAASTMRSS